MSAAWSQTSGLALAEALLGDDGLFPMAPVQTGVTVGDRRNARRLGALTVGDQEYLVYTYRDRERHELAAARLTRSVARLGDKFPVAIDRNHSWAHAIGGQASATIYNLGSTVTGQERPIAEHVVRRRRVITPVDVRGYRAGTWTEVAACAYQAPRLTRLDDRRVLVTEKDSPHASLCDVAAGSARALDSDPRFGHPIAGLGDGRALAVGPAQTEIWSADSSSWETVAKRPRKKVRVGAHALLADGNLLMTFFAFDGGSAGGFDWSDERSWLWRFDPVARTWQTSPEKRHNGAMLPGLATRVPIAAATRLDDGRVMLCEEHRKLLFDPGSVGRQAFIDSGPALRRDELFRPRVFAVRDGGCVAIVDTVAYPARSRYQAHYERWVLLYQASSGYWELARKVRRPGTAHYVQLTPEVLAVIKDARQKSGEPQKSQTRGRLEFCAPVQGEWSVRAPRLPFVGPCRAALGIDSATLLAAAGSALYRYRIPG